MNDTASTSIHPFDLDKAIGLITPSLYSRIIEMRAILQDDTATMRTYLAHAVVRMRNLGVAAPVCREFIKYHLECTAR